MRYLLLLLSFSLSVPAHDVGEENLSGIWYNPNKAGEGIFVTHNEKFGTLAWGFFTHNPLEDIRDCIITDPVTGDFGEILRPGEEFCIEYTIGGSGQWYIAGDLWHGSSSGVVYQCEAYDYPLLRDTHLCEERTVGMYIMDYTQIDGFRLIITPTGGDAPDTLYQWYYFPTVIAKAQNKEPRE